jgi:hypothetical protein
MGMKNIRTLRLMQAWLSTREWQAENLLLSKCAGGGVHRFLHHWSIYFYYTVLRLKILLTYLLTPWCRTYFQKLIVTQLVKQYPVFVWNPKVHYRAHKSPLLGPILSQPNPVRPTYPYIPKVHLNVILPPTPRSSQWSLTFGPPNQTPANTSHLLHARHVSRPPHTPWFRWRIQAMKFIIMHFSPLSVFLSFRYKYPQHSFLKNP